MTLERRKRENMETQNKSSSQGIHYYQLGGSSPKMLFVHGLFGSGKNWQNYLKWVWKTFSIPVAAVDQRGHGKSPAFSGPGKLDLLAQDLEKLIQEIASEPILVLGHSLGAKVAMGVASSKPELVQRLMVVDTNLNAVREDLLPFIDKLSSLPLPLASRRDGREKLEEFIEDRHILEFMLTNLVQIEEGWNWRIDLKGLREVVEELIQRSLKKEWDSLTCPLTLVRGMDSLQLSSKEAKSMVRIHGRKADLVEIPGAGHWCHVDQPQRFKKALKTFIEEA